MTGQNRFHIVDFVVFAITIIISIGIGIFYAFSGGKQKTTSGFHKDWITKSLSTNDPEGYVPYITELLLGGRLISYIPVAISLMVSFESSIMMLGIPAEGYAYGMQYLIGTFGFLISQLLSINLIVPLLHPLKITSAYEYLEFRFNSTAVRRLGTVFGILHYCWYMGIVLFGPAVALEAVTGFPMWASIATISLVAVIYTSIGGLKAVVWTDVFQAFVMFAGIFAILIKGTMEVGGSQEVWDTAVRGGRANFFVFDLDPRVRHTFFNLLFSSTIRGFALTFNQSTVQRISSTKSVKEAKRVLLLVGPAFAVSFLLTMMEGIVAFAYYVKKECDPFESGQLTNPNQIVPFFVMDIFSELPGMPGLFLASLFSASLSTLSSGLSSLSALLWADIVHPLVGDISEFKATLIVKFSVIAFGGLACGLAFLVSMIGGTLIQIASSVLSAFAGPVTGLFLMGCFCHRSNSKGALGGGIFGFVLSCWLSFGMNFSSAIKKTPWLPHAPTDQCFPDDLLYNDTMTTTMATNITTTMSPSFVSDMMTTVTLEASEPQGVEVFYSLSYTFVAPFGILSTIFIGYIISLLTGPNKPGDVDPRYLLEFSKVILIFMPSSVKKWASSKGAQFIKEEYKSKFPDPALREKMDNTEMTILPPELEGDGAMGAAGEPLLLKMTSHTDHENTHAHSGGDDGHDDDKNKNINNGSTVNGAPAAIIITNEKNKNNNRNSSSIVLHVNGDDYDNNGVDENCDNTNKDNQATGDDDTVNDLPPPPPSSPLQMEASNEENVDKNDKSALVTNDDSK